MRAISIRQPWAWLIVNGYKPVENRDWKTTYRGHCLIHAGKMIDRAGYEFVKDQFPELYAMLPPVDKIERGGVVGMVKITDCVEKHLSLWFFGKYGFVMDDAATLPFFPHAGQLGFFNIDYMEDTNAPRF